MVTEKKMYYSNITNEYYETLNAAELAEADAISETTTRGEYVKSLVERFHEIRNKYNTEMVNLKSHYECDLDEIIKTLKSIGVTELELNTADITPVKSVYVKRVKVRPIRIK